MIELSEEWLAETARQAADDEDAWYAARPTWLDLEDEPSAIIEGSRTAANADKRWATKFPVLAKHRSRFDIRSWRDAGARQTAPVFPLFATVKRRSAA
jgi:hypothetical protein